MRRRVRLRTLLGLVVLTTVVSFGLFAGFLVLSSWQQQRAVINRQNEDLATAVSAAVDREVLGVQTTLEVLGRLRTLARANLDGFEDIARRLVPDEAGWRAVLLADASGQVLIDTARDEPDRAPGGETVWASAVIQAARPFYSDLTRGSGAQDDSFIVAVPIVVDGTLQYALAARVSTSRLTAVLLQQESPPDGVFTLVDRDLQILARTQNEDRFRGGLPAGDFQEAARRMDVGSWEATLLEGTPSYASLRRSRLTGWTVGLGMARNVVDGPLVWTLLTLGGVGALLLFAGGCSVMLLAREVVPALDAAAASAKGLVRGTPVPPVPSRIVEVASLFEGLHGAEATLVERERARDEAERGRDLAALARERALVAEKAARQDAERANRLKDEFLMAISHELRTPLTAICGWSRMLSRGEVAAGQQQRALDAIDRNARALTLIVNDLIDVSQSQTGKLRLDLRQVAIGEVVDAAIDSVRPAADARHLSIARAPVPDGAVVRGDPDRLQQVIWNVLANAVKFTPPGGRVTVTTASTDTAVEVAVSDTGPGINEEFLPYVFDRFRQEHGGQVRIHRGLGLGLSIVRHLTEMHGGTVHAANNPDGPGATFRIVLPRAA